MINRARWEKVILLIMEILRNYCSIELREGIETLINIFRMLIECLIFYCFSLNVLLLFLSCFKAKFDIN